MDDAKNAAASDESSFKTRKNIYTCQNCFGHIVTVDLEEGVTPFMITCRATADCRGAMQSSMYRVFDQTMRASHEWYRPDTLQNLNKAEASHVAQGGLLLREAARAQGGQQ